MRTNTYMIFSICFRKSKNIRLFPKSTLEFPCNVQLQHQREAETVGAEYKHHSALGRDSFNTGIWPLKDHKSISRSQQIHTTYILLLEWNKNWSSQKVTTYAHVYTHTKTNTHIHTQSKGEQSTMNCNSRVQRKCLSFSPSFTLSLSEKTHTLNTLSQTHTLRASCVYGKAVELTPAVGQLGCSKCNHCSSG